MNKNGIRDIAQQTGLSAGTISIVLNGRGDELRISRKTQERIWQEARQLGYQPNIHARRLRKGTGGTDMVLIALMWPSRYTPELLVRFFDGIRDAIIIDGLPIEVVYKPYPSNALDTCAEIFRNNLFHGALVVGASDVDMAYLREESCLTPVVLFNRQSPEFATVCADDARTGTIAATLMHARGHRQVALVDGDMPMRHRLRRREGFLHACAQLGLSVPEECVLTETADEAGGRTAALALLDMKERPTAIFFSLGSMVPGAYRVFEESGLQIPGDMEIIGYADTVLTPMLRPGLTVVDLPVQRIVRRLLALLMDRINGRVQDPVTLIEETPVLFRESMPDPALFGKWVPRELAPQASDRPRLPPTR